MSDLIIMPYESFYFEGSAPIIEFDWEKAAGHLGIEVVDPCVTFMTLYCAIVRLPEGWSCSPWMVESEAFKIWYRQNWLDGNANCRIKIDICAYPSGKIRAMSTLLSRFAIESRTTTYSISPPYVVHDRVKNTDLFCSSDNAYAPIVEPVTDRWMRCRLWLDEHYPDWHDSYAYWD